MSLVDYDELVCESCGNVGLLPDGDLDVVCPVCDWEGSLIKEEEDYED